MARKLFCESAWSRFALSCLGLALMLMFIAPQRIEAQALYGSITGNVQDANGAAIPGATVTLTSTETNQSREATTDESGGYTFTNIQTGNYSVKVSQQGFKTLTKTDVAVTLNTTTRNDLTMDAGQVAETVTVTSDAAILQTETAEVKGELGTVQLANLPVPHCRNYQNLFNTLPGFSETSEPHSNGSNPSRALDFNVNGASRSINNTRIDGASATNIWLPHITAYVPALESIQAVNVVTNSFDAEQGLAGGAAVNVSIKSGTNDFRGAAFGYNSTHALAARPYNFSGPLRDNPKLIYN